MLEEDYKRIEKAIQFIVENQEAQPSLEEIAKHVHVSPSHFHRLFTEWVGVSPKKFLQHVTINLAKKLLKRESANLFTTSIACGLSSTSRLHDLFVSIEGMTPAEYKNNGQSLVIQYSFADSHFGNIIIANTAKGICYIAFIQSEEEGLKQLVMKFPYATFKNESSFMQKNVLHFYQNDWTNLSEVKLHLKGTPFQLNVWESLLKIPPGQLTTYGTIAGDIDREKAFRAVGTAIGENPVALLIPCHRVIQQSGLIGGYRWGTTKKRILIAWEAAQEEQNI